MKQELSKEQEKIAFHNHCEGAILVKASAGSGKTRILTERVRYLLTEKKNRYFSVLCLTFTNKSAEEIQERLNDIPKLKERAVIGTFHKFCLHNIVQKRKHEIGIFAEFQIFDDKDQQKLLSEILNENPFLDEEYNSLNAKEKDTKLNKYLREFSELKQNLALNFEEIDEQTKNIYEEYNICLKNQNAMDFDDILLYAYEILTNKNNKRTAQLYAETYKYIMVDEAQDLNPARYAIVKALCNDTHQNIMMVGDTKQAIFGFSGASAKFMEDDFTKDFEVKEFTIEHNYRSAKKILALAEHIKPNNQPSKIAENNAFFEGETSIKSFQNEEEEAKHIIEQIKFWQEKGFYEEKEVKETITLKDICVLGRNRFVFSKIISLLEKDETLKDNFYLNTGVEKFEAESILMKVFFNGLKIIANPKNDLHFKQIFKILDIEFFIIQKNINNDFDSLNTLLALSQYETKYLSKEILNFMIDLWQKIQKNQKWIGEAINKIHQKIQENITEWGNYFTEHEIFKIENDISELQKFWIAFSRNEPIERHNIENFDYFLKLEGSKEHKQELTLATIHATKGLEFKVVFLMGANEGVLPDFRAKTEKQINEERNTAYVAITRAKRCFYVTYPSVKITQYHTEKSQKISSFFEKALQEVSDIFSII